jgi:hypothetical protein
MLDRNDEPFADDPEGLKEYKRMRAFRRRAWEILRQEKAEREREENAENNTGTN